MYVPQRNFIWIICVRENQLGGYVLWAFQKDTQYFSVQFEYGSSKPKALSWCSRELKILSQHMVDAEAAGRRGPGGEQPLALSLSIFQIPAYTI